MHILAFSGSSSSNSINQKLIHIVAKLFSSVSVEVIDIREYPAPFYSWDEEQENGIPEHIQRLREEMNKANGYLISSPEYNGSMPAYYKNTIDWLSRMPEKVFNDKPVVLMSTSNGARGGMTNLAELSKLAPFWGAKLMGSHSVKVFNEKIVDGKLIDSERDEIMKCVNALQDAILSPE